MSDVVVRSVSNLRNEVSYGSGHTLITDEPAEVGGEDAGPDPYVLLLAALGSCISMTVTLYAREKVGHSNASRSGCDKDAFTQKTASRVRKQLKAMFTGSSAQLASKEISPRSSTLVCRR